MKPVAALRRKVQLQRVRSVLKETGMDAVVAISPENVGYLAGCVIPSHPLVRRRHAIYLAPLEREGVLLVADIEQEHAQKYSSVRDVRGYKEFFQDPIDLLADVISEIGLDKKKIGIEMDYTPAGDFQKLQSRLPNAKFERADRMLEEVGEIKTPREIELIKKMGKIAESSELDAFKSVSQGMTELDLGKALVGGLYSRGADGIKLLVVCSGERSSLPNAGPTSKTLNHGDIVRVDLLGSLSHFYSDVARTVVVGEASPRQESIWKRLVEVQHEVLDVVKPGLKVSELYAVYAKAMKKRGLPPARFVGHGLGLGMHETPILGEMVHTTIKENMILCIEPFTLDPGAESYQVEDEIIVTKDGYELITDSMDTSELFVIK